MLRRGESVTDVYVLRGNVMRVFRLRGSETCTCREGVYCACSERECDVYVLRGSMMLSAEREYDVNVLRRSLMCMF